MRRVRDAARRHPRWVDAGGVAVLALLDGQGAVRPGTGVLPWAWYVAVHLPLVFRRRAPAPVFWLVYALALLDGGTVGVRLEGIYPEAAVLLAVHAVARHAPRWQLWPVVLAIELPAAAVFLSRGPAWVPLGFVSSALAATVLLGVTAATRQAYLAGLEERARQLEHERDQQARLATAAERARIARELHDIVAHNLTVIVALADGASASTATAPGRSAEAMRLVSETGRQALGEMRRLVGVLNDDERADRAPQPGLDDVDALVEQVRAAGLRVSSTVRGAPAGWGPGAGLAVYRIVQEALTNTLKHAGPQASAQVRVDHHAAGLELEVTDDGGHRPGGEPGHGHGLAGMADRAAAYGGRVEAGPRRDGPGWRVRLELPLPDGGADGEVRP